jgi:hypothetical protein
MSDNSKRIYGDGRNDSLTGMTSNSETFQIVSMSGPTIE